MRKTDDIGAGGLSLHDLTECIPRLRRFARSMTRDEAAADDLLQDCLERAMLKSHLFDGKNLNAWLTTICRRIFLNSMRKQKRSGSQIPIEFADGEALAAPAPQEQALFLHQVLETLEKLSFSDQRIIAFAACDGLDYSRISEEMRINIGTVRSRLSRARAKLRAATIVADGTKS